MSVSFIESVWSALRAQHARGGPDAPWLVAFSGGTDSLALALLLRRFARAEPAPKITLVHIDHGLHEASRDWAAAAELLSAKVGFPFHAVRVSVSSANGIEAGARTVRYDALGSLLEPGGAVLTAHHQQDQAETVLLRLMRGAGVEGLGAMAAYRRFRDGWLVRPLLDADRRELAEMVRNSGLEPLHDPANDDRRFDRSFLRAEIMPVLRGRWPAMDRTLARSAKLHRASARELARTARALEADVAGQCRGTLSRLRLATLDPAQAALVLRHWLAKRGLRALPARRLEGLVSALRGSAGSPTCAIDGMQVRCYRDDVFVVAPRQSRSTPPGDWAPPESLELANGTLLATAAVGAGVARKWFDSGEVSVAYRVAGDRCVMHDGVRHQSMKKLFQTHGVPPWNRDFWPLLKAGDAVIAVPGIYVSQTYMAGPDELGWILEWQWH